MLPSPPPPSRSLSFRPDEQKRARMSGVTLRRDFLFLIIPPGRTPGTSVRVWRVIAGFYRSGINYPFFFRVSIHRPRRGSLGQAGGCLRSGSRAKFLRWRAAPRSPEGEVIARNVTMQAEGHGKIGVARLKQHECLPSRLSVKFDTKCALVFRGRRAVLR